MSAALDAFLESLAGAAPKRGLGRLLQALWWEAKGDWSRAHELAQAEDGAEAALVHAYLHRKEGDAGNAAYWYRRAGTEPVTGPLQAEWRRIAERLLKT